ncbi:hypothetical protein PBI_OMNICRON_47 [Mycobacterium phage Omnicron]|uniref:Uncharacterized protein n=1 Tax=Mycobacterium phage Omnicron TaxID=1541819 RepID=A0A088FQ55_9CAUD|nr:hypothetical protein PBI_OMNICRON_47 [Mycobacterium phage Omnicron]AIM50380.1 hypothetical protein PBI_OMNICRON_47 [Mycobacterium phage Omnicron]
MSHHSVNHQPPVDQHQNNAMSTGSFIGWTLLLTTTLIGAIALGAMSVGLL